MADGTKAVVDTSAADAAADEAALAAAIDELGRAKTAPAGTADARSAKASANASTEASTDASSDPSVADDEDAPPAPQGDPDDAPKGDPDTGPDAEPDRETAVSEETSEITAPLSVDEIAAELAAGSPRKKPAPAPETAPAKRRPTDPQPTVDPRDTATLPRTLPAPMRHSGDKIGNRYLLEECISQTETFSSWRAVDEKLRRAVGVHLMASGHQRARKVLAAAKSAALLGDPRFVQVLDAVQENELVYVVREWLPHASDLAKLLVNGPMEPHEAYQMVRQVADAVAAAHRRGKAHLRLTPRCVLRTDSGQYRINGIAVDAALRGLPPEDSTEDAQRTDTRAIGALLFAALTHRWPYPEDRYDLKGLPKGLQNAAPDQVRAGVHKGLSELAARALFDHPPHHAAPITTPEELVRAIAQLPRIRQPEPELPAFPTPPRHNTHALPTAPNPTRVADTTVAPLPASSRPTAARRSRRRLRRVVKATAWTVALGAIGVASWQFVGSLRHTGQAVATPQPSVSTAAPSPHGTTTHAPVPITVKDAQSFNPLGDGPEGTASVKNAIDGDPGTAWTTNWYNDQLGPKPPSLKSGTGLLLDLGSPQSVSSVDVQFIGEHTAELRVPGTAGANPPGTRPENFTVVGKKSGPSADYTLDSPITTRYLLIWLTALPKDGDGRFQGKVAEVKVFG
ncbi:serine/threonine protein kinase [Kitasatospora cathayae]|uniref:Serine/threonine protein kinase n=1 Tax=Kitasatospora cathayae TaxID=3004092 RepID=A0ABY7Q595_9ACTN|nr:serine/threonine protein kinase [Kitasatospora sp. HUAS 3-15]WBP87870.1 serine/threonine protein kinase [Kitasatospora sp. HUAS 3-15]